MHIESGRTIVITAASGGVGGFAVQLASIAGLKIIATCSTKNSDWVKALGSNVHVIDYTSENVIERVRAIAGGERAVDYWLDSIGPSSVDAGLSTLAFGGKIAVNYGGPSKEGFEAAHAFLRGLSICNVLLGGAHGADERHQRELVVMGTRMLELLREGQLKSMVEKVISGLDQVPAALQEFKAGHQRGKAIVRVVE